METNENAVEAFTTRNVTLAAGAFIAYRGTVSMEPDGSTYKVSRTPADFGARVARREISVDLGDLSLGVDHCLARKRQAAKSGGRA